MCPSIRMVVTGSDRRRLRTLCFDIIKPKYFHLPYIKHRREEEKAIYNATMISANTSYCHHYTQDGRHIVLHKLPVSTARKCKGVLYLGIGWSGKRIKCGAPRGADVVKAGHDPCTAERCPYIRDYGKCPYMAT